MNDRVQALVQQYQMIEHPEGGYYAEHYRSPVHITLGEERSLSTAIYFLLPQGSFSAFHRLDADECWHFYEGGPLDVFVFTENGLVTHHLDGKTLHSVVVPAHHWFASRPAAGAGYSLCGCTVSPAFLFSRFQLAEAKVLSLQYPLHAQIIGELCRL